MKYMGPEDQLQHQICQLLDLHNFYYFHPCQEGKRTRWEVARIKYLGMKAGVPDLIIILQHGRVHWVEIKTPKGRVQESQTYFREIVESRGHTYEIWRNIADAQNFCLKYGGVR